MKKVLFVCASDTLVRLLLPINKQLKLIGYEVEFSKLQMTDEMAEYEIAINLARECYIGSVKHNAGWLSRYSVIVMGNDWGKEIRSIIGIAEKIGVPTVCVQESVINFDDNVQRMRFAEYVLTQGEVSASHLSDRSKMFITGNPRYENLKFTPCVGSEDVMVNCNFTYGVEEVNREKWMDDVIHACDDVGVNIVILQHPRDNSNLSKYGKRVIQTSASTIHAHLMSGHTLITRFSSLIHEALAIGRPVVYYNPFREKIGYDFGVESTVLKRPQNKIALVKSIKQCVYTKYTENHFSEYLGNHIRPTTTLPSVACANAINQIVRGNSSVRIKNDGKSMTSKVLLIQAWSEKLKKILRGRV